MYLVAENKKVLSVVFLFFFIIYGFSIAGIDMRYPITALCFVWTLLISKKIVFPKYIQGIIVFLIGMGVYAFIMAVLCSTRDYFETLRFLRCIITLLLIVQIISAFDISAQKMFYVIKLLLLLNAVAIILGIIWPQFKEIIHPISQYYKEFSQFRSSGLFDGEDAAGFFCVIGLIMETVERVYKKKSPLSLFSFVFLFSVVFTSRFSLLLAVVVLFIDVYVLFKQKNYKHILGLMLILMPMVIIMTSMWIMTTGFGMQYRQILINKFPFLVRLFTMLSSSYLDYGVFTETLKRHVMVVDFTMLDYIFGKGYRAAVKQDVGYIKSLYSIGIIGIIAEISFYLNTIRKCQHFANQPKYIVTTYKIIILVMILMEIKNSFILASSVFEVTMCIYLTLYYTSERDAIHYTRKDEYEE